MSTPAVSIIMRSFNEAWALGNTLAALKAQSFTDWELIVIDSGSTDGSPDMIRAANPAHFIQIASSEYNPSRVMNHGMRLARAELCIFLNADATPQGPEWLRPLVEALSKPNVAAVFGQQVPRPDCEMVFASDYDRCFGPARESAKWEHFFSMVSSGIHKSVWARRGFREDLQYAEDDEYTRWCRAEGHLVQYVPTSIALHSHNYTPEQAWKRSFGDARAIGRAWPASRSIAWSALHTVILGWLSDVRHDARYALRVRRVGELPHAMRIRWMQRTGKLAGFRAGYAETHTTRESATNPKYQTP